MDINIAAIANWTPAEMAIGCTIILLAGYGLESILTEYVIPMGKKLLPRHRRNQQE